MCICLWITTVGSDRGLTHRLQKHGPCCSVMSALQQFAFPARHWIIPLQSVNQTVLCQKRISHSLAIKKPLSGWMESIKLWDYKNEERAWTVQHIQKVTNIRRLFVKTGIRLCLIPLIKHSTLMPLGEFGLPWFKMRQNDGPFEDDRDDAGQERDRIPELWNHKVAESQNLSQRESVKNCKQRLSNPLFAISVSLLWNRRSFHCINLCVCLL